jgi:O-antigen/teichoic acid export membrane protein
MIATTATPGLKPDQVGNSVAPHARQISLSQVVKRLLRMAVLLVAARLLGVELFGTYALLLTVMEMAAMISGCGYIDFLTREIAKRPDAGWNLGVKTTEIRLVYLAPVVGIALLLLKALHFPSSLIFNAALLSVALIPRSVSESAQGVIKGLQRFSLLPWIEFVQGSIVLAVAPSLINFGLGIRGMIAAEILGATGGAVVAVLGVARSLDSRSSDERSFHDVMRSTVVFNIYPFIVNIYDRVDVVLLSKLAGNVATGIYSLPYRAFATLQIIPYSVMTALLPVFSANAADQDSRETCSRAMKFLYITALMVVLVTLTLARPAVLYILGQSYSGCILTMKILVWAAVPGFLNYALNTLLLAAHKENFFLWTAGVCTVFNISANLLLIPKFSFLAAAVVTVLTEVLLYSQNFYLATKLLGGPVLPKDWKKITLIFVAALTCFLFLRRLVPESWAGSLAALVFCASLVPMSSDFAALPRLGRLMGNHRER